MRHFIATLLCLAAYASTAQDAPDANKPFTLLVVVDGLRPDYITAERTPALHALAEGGVSFENHHAVFPTVTRVNAASIVTGAYPGAHGVMENTIYIPEADPEKPLSTADWENLKKVEEATGGKLYLIPTLGELLEQNGQKLLVCSAGSSGSAFLLNHRAANAGAVINNDFTLPESLHARVIQELAEAPPEDIPNLARNKRAVDALLGVGMQAVQPNVAILWLSDPDHTAHAKGMGSPETEAALAAVDAEIGRAVEGVRSAHPKANILVTSDHGFSTYNGDVQPYIRIQEIMRGLQINPDDYVAAGTGIYLKESTPELVQKVCAKFQREEWVGAVFSPKQSDEIPFGEAMGTMGFGFLRYENARTPQLVITPVWTDDEAVPGFPGTTGVIGIAGHGGFSPQEVHNVFIASGPVFKKGLKNSLPTGNVDIAPTILRLQRLRPAESMEGRVVDEAFTTGPDIAANKPQNQIFRVQVGFPEGGSYYSEVKETRVFGKRYHSYGKGWREAASVQVLKAVPVPGGVGIPSPAPIPMPSPIPAPAPIPAPQPIPVPGQPALPGQPAVPE